MRLCVRMKWNGEKFEHLQKENTTTALAKKKMHIKGTKTVPYNTEYYSNLDSKRKTKHETRKRRGPSAVALLQALARRLNRSKRKGAKPLLPLELNSPAC